MNIQPTYLLFIGADSDTGFVDTATIRNVLTERHEGFTIWDARGFWITDYERSVVVAISPAPEENVLGTVHVLKVKLSQLAIGVITLPGMEMI